MGADLHEKRRVALVSMLACLGLVLAKTAAGYLSNSVGVLSEAASSSLDLVVTLLTYVSVRVAEKPADANHPYGHDKIENVSAFLETVLLLVACSWIVWEALTRLAGQAAQVEVTPWLVGVLVGSMAVDFFRARALAAVARRHDSQALEADALHFAVDFWTTGVVLLGVVAVWAGDRFEMPWLRHADPIAALGVACTILVLLFKLGRRSLSGLMDESTEDLRAAVVDAAQGVEGVLAVEKVRARRSGSRHFVDLTVGVARTLPFERVHAITERIERAVRERMPNTDIVVHPEPRAHGDESIFDRIRAIAQRSDLMVHELTAHRVFEDGTPENLLVIDLDAEVDERLTLREAHALVDRVEAEILERHPEVTRVNFHLETLGRDAVPASALAGLTHELEEFLGGVRAKFPEVLDCHDVQVRRAEGKIVASCHAVLDGEIPIVRVHDLTQQVEDWARRHFPQIARISIHGEPPESG